MRQYIQCAGGWGWGRGIQVGATQCKYCFAMAGEDPFLLLGQSRFTGMELCLVSKVSWGSPRGCTISTQHLAPWLAED